MNGLVGSNPTPSAMNRTVHGSARTWATRCDHPAAILMPRFYYVYVLRSLRDAKLYIGSTTDLRKRLTMHNSGLVTSTKPRLPFELSFYEAYRNPRDARRREEYFKTTKGKTIVRTMLRE